MYQFSISEEISKFLIVSHARSGSNLLFSCLNSHPDIITEHEIFAAHKRKIGENFYPIINQLFRERPENIKAVGCKAFYYHLNKEEWQELVKIPELKIIHLKRKNRLRTIVSLKVAFKTNQWGMKHESEKIDISQKKVYLDHENLRKSFENIDFWEEDIKNMFTQHCIQDVYYEDLVHHADNALKPIFDLLDVEQISQEEINIKLKKQNPEPLSALIQNYQELCEKFNNTPWQHYFSY